MQRPFKLAILSDEVSQDLDTVLGFATEFALDGIEVRSLFGRAFIDLTPADHRQIASRCRDAGLLVAGCASPVFKCDLDHTADIATHGDLFKRSLDAAQTLGCDLVRVFSFLRRSTPATPADLQRAASHFGKLLELAAGSGVRIGLENEASCIVGTGDETREFLSHLPNDNRLGVVWDPCNVLYVTGSGDPVRDDFPKVADRVIHVHAKDARREADGAATTCVELGTGEVDFPTQFEALKARAYAGWVSLETHWRKVALDAHTQHLPAGHAFSNGAEPASRICMGHLQNWLRAPAV